MYTIKLNSCNSEVEELQSLLNIPVTGTFDQKTKNAVIKFQKEHNLDADGIVGYYTWEKLFFYNRPKGLDLTENDYKLAAKLINVDVATLKAVKDVESGPYGGFLKSGRPTILFEGHIFWSQLKKAGIDPNKYAQEHSDILFPKWDKSKYLSGEKEWDRLNKARKINQDAANASASWGLFQIMGFNYLACGEKSVQSFVDMMSISELHQLLLSVRFIKNGGMLPALQTKNWAEFAKRYNGPAYAKNKYDIKLKQAYEKYV